MGYSKRIDTLCSLLTEAESFADVGCDHGYCSEYMLKNGLCKRVIFSDISKGSLAKAEKLLAPYVRSGQAKGVLGNGFFGVERDTDEVLIAGMGGAEIIAILSDKKHGFMPKRFVLQPMHDTTALRKYILQNGGYIERDFTLEDGKFYDVLTGVLADENHVTKAYSEMEYEFGRENLQLKNAAFVKRTKKLIGNIEKYLRIPSLGEESKRELTERKARLEEALQV